MGSIESGSTLFYCSTCRLRDKFTVDGGPDLCDIKNIIRKHELRHHIKTMLKR